MKKYLEYFDGAFDSTVAEKIKPENKPYVAYSKTEGVVFTIIPNETGTMYTIYRVVSKDISNCTYNMVDLGLKKQARDENGVPLYELIDNSHPDYTHPIFTDEPLLFADRNVGAASPEDFGSYFQWGDTNAYTFDGIVEVTAAELASLLQPLVGDEMEVTADNVGMILEQMGITGTDLTNTPMGPLGCSLDKEFNWSSYFDTTDGGSTFNKYNNNEGLTVLESSDDAATAHMGSNYRMPTSAEIQELIKNTTQTFIDLDGNEYDKQYVYDNKPIEAGKLKGVRFTGSNDNSIFIPAAGICGYSLLTSVYSCGHLWSSFLGDNYDAYILPFDEDNVGGYSHSDRCYGLSVRGVQL